jgi:hypothetical protein
MPMMFRLPLMMMLPFTLRAAVAAAVLPAALPALPCRLPAPSPFSGVSVPFGHTISSNNGFPKYL